MAAVISRLLVYPIKGCRGLAVPSAQLAPTGLAVDGIGDREWVVVDDDGEFLSQRELPKMALVATRLTADALVITAPGMTTLDVPLATEGERARIRVWHDELDARTQGAHVDRWFSDFLGRPARLMRFDPRARRISPRRFTGVIEAPYKFADAFALLVASEASLADVNRRLAAKGEAAVGMDRFRPNIVIDGVDAFEEDYASQLAAGDARIEFVKPCVRCTVPSVDPVRGEQGHEPGDTLAAYRRNAEAGGVTFGVNGVVAHGAGATLAVGDAVGLTLRF